MKEEQLFTAEYTNEALEQLNALEDAEFTYIQENVELQP